MSGGLRGGACGGGGNSGGGNDGGGGGGDHGFRKLGRGQYDGFEAEKTRENGKIEWRKGEGNMKWISPSMALPFNSARPSFHGNTLLPYSSTALQFYRLTALPPSIRSV